MSCSGIWTWGCREAIRKANVAGEQMAEARAFGIHQELATLTPLGREAGYRSLLGECRLSWTLDRATRLP